MTTDKPTIAVRTIESAFTRDWPDADCYRDAVNGQQTGKPFCSCAPGVCAKRANG